MIEYKPTILTYIDILGFRDIQKSKSPQEIYDILSFLKRQAKPSDSECKNLEINFLNFSDLIVRATNILSESNVEYPIGLLFHEFLSVCCEQTELIAKETIVRGAITIGESYSEEGMLFGPALSRAYELESEVAIYPRVIIDPIVFKSLDESELLRYELHELEVEKYYLKNYVRKDTDGIYYIDYLRAAVHNLDEPEDFFVFLYDHKNLTEKFSGKSKELNKNMLKASWLAHYHNSTVKNIESDYFRQFDYHKEDFIIDLNNFPILYDLDEHKRENT